MSFFAKSVSPVPSLQPISLDRIAEVLTSEDINFGFSDDRERLGGYWGEHLVEFILYGQTSEVLQVRAHWGRPLEVARWSEMLERVNANNSERIWPKIYVDRDDEVLAVMAEHSIDYEHGATDAQIMQHVQCAISTSLSAFERLDEAYPEAVAAWHAAHPDWDSGE
ncbi:MAG: YbjN domain-containing protein [Micrococcales bacterium]|nr:YbjN domain-containing protein [Micrococcales bacterium]